MTSQIMIHHDEPNHLFFAIVDNRKCVLEYKEQAPGVYEYHNTMVPSALRHQGIAGKLAEFALEWALKNHKKVVPSCSFIMGYIAKNKRFRTLVE